MLDRLTDSLVNLLYGHCTLSADRRAVYSYGCKLAISTLFSICSILLLSALFGKFLYGILFVLIFVSLRLFLGGFHATTYRNCFLITNGTFLVTCGAAVLLSYLGSFLVSLLILFTSVSVIILLGPVKNHNHPISDTTFRKNKRVGFLLLGIEIFLCAVLYYATKNIDLLSITAASLAAVAAMMVPPTIEKGGMCHD